MNRRKYRRRSTVCESLSLNLPFKFRDEHFADGQVSRRRISPRSWPRRFLCTENSAVTTVGELPIESSDSGAGSTPSERRRGVAFENSTASKRRRRLRKRSSGHREKQFASCHGEFLRLLIYKTKAARRFDRTLLRTVPKLLFYFVSLSSFFFLSFEFPLESFSISLQVTVYRQRVLNITGVTIVHRVTLYIHVAHDVAIY